MTKNTLSRHFYPSHPMDRTMRSMASRLFGYDPFGADYERMMGLSDMLREFQAFADASGTASEESASAYIDRTENGEEFTIWTKGSYPKIRITKELSDTEVLKGLTILAAVPGISKEDISLNIKNGVITIETRKIDPVESAPKGTVIINEIPQRHAKLEVGVSGGSFSWDEVTAELEDHGMLKIYIPAVEKPGPAKIEIKGK